ncbi:Phosphatidylinositol-binding clathrin assembly protein [Chondrus crispus]|uniref:Phosphatidylinositol-binding clathrin assembly protein n=1 Tax=Chondrus crispus TaxID=2769 RepID=R7Q9X8_CHOCR|nr:Phosphatidylinositol-binding clathrin assembly protein [Chondrus crispus]CDF34211.1 Phosphatidylinositol-binding clathrin assembly protein [Chondrus crispus]|eukprot:XP_005714030.1 Phosphatidylinositol-binding clathrin assembly protein [Chondrus crispus]
MNAPPPRPSAPSIQDKPGPRTSSFTNATPEVTPPAPSRSSSLPLSAPSTSGRVENPYLTNAYASSRPGGSTSQYSDVGGMDASNQFYMSSRQKGNMQGKLKDTLKSTMAAAKQDNWKIVCVKATSHHLVPPKGKHVRVIMEGLRFGGSISNRESPVGGIFYHLRKRLMLSNWVVVIKALTIFHHIFRDGNEKFVEYVAVTYRSMFKMDFFADGSSEGFAHSGFIRTYGAYIEQWLTMKAAINFPPGKSKEDDTALTGLYRNASIEDLLAALPVVMDTVDALLGLQLQGQTRHSPVANPAFTMILRDMTIFWITLSEGLIRLLDLYFELDIPKAVIALDVYKRFVAMVSNAQPFFENARSLPLRWQIPELGAISLELMDSMQEYIDRGPQVPEDPQYSDQEEYDEPEPEPEPEPVPEDYYEPEPVYYSEEEPEQLPPPRPRAPPPVSSSSSESEASTEESSSEEEEDDTDVLPTAPKPAPTPKPFDPLADLLGIETGVTANGHGNMATAAQPAMALQVYGAQGNVPGMYQPATLEHTVDDRVANVKGIMAATTHGGGQQQRSGFGVDGTNMQVAMYGQQQPQNPHAQARQAQQHLYNSVAMQQQQQQMMAYQSMAAYQTMANQQMANQQMAMYQMQQQSTANGMGGMAPMNGMQRMGMMGAYQPVPQGNQSVPVMQAEGQARQMKDYKVQKGTKPTRVNDDDMAFGPLLDQMKKTKIGN